MATSRRSRRRHEVVFAALLFVVALLAGSAKANDRTAFLVDRLKSDDPRVRGQAALQLGTTNDDAAVQPLCGALSDGNDFVRNAAIAALKRLGRPSAVPCLRDRLSSETNDAARTAIQGALSALAGGGGGGGGGGGAPDLSNVAGAKYYIALSRIANNTGRPAAEIEAIVMGAIKAKLAAMGNAQLAPSGESPTAARAAIAAKHMKGYYFSIAVDAFDYSGGNLRVKVKIAVFTYPGKDLRGEVPVSPVQSGVSPGDHGSEDNLMGLAAGHAVELFAQSFP
jgi:hypothetical protein